MVDLCLQADGDRGTVRISKGVGALGAECGSYGVDVTGHLLPNCQAMTVRGLTVTVTVTVTASVLKTKQPRNCLFVILDRNTKSVTHVYQTLK